MESIVKQANKDDIDLLLPLFESYREFYGQEPSPSEAKKFLLNLLANDASVIFIVYKGEEAVAFTQLYPLWSSVSMSKVWILNDLFVEQSSRNQGLAKILMNAARDFAKGTGAIRLKLATQVDNHIAKELYKSEGWIKDEEFDNYYFNL